MGQRRRGGNPSSPDRGLNFPTRHKTPGSHLRPGVFRLPPPKKGEGRGRGSCRRQPSVRTLAPNDSDRNGVAQGTSGVSFSLRSSRKRLASSLMLYSLPETFVSTSGVEPPALNRSRRDETGGRNGYLGPLFPSGGRFRWRKGSRQWRIAGVGPASSLSRRQCGKGDGAGTHVFMRRSKVAWSTSTISIALAGSRTFGKRPVSTPKPAHLNSGPSMTLRSSRDCIFSLDHVDSRRPPKPPALSRVPLAVGLVDRAADQGSRPPVARGMATSRPCRLAGRIERQRRRDRSEA